MIRKRKRFSMSFQIRVRDVLNFIYYLVIPPVVFYFVWNYVVVSFASNYMKPISALEVFFAVSAGALFTWLYDFFKKRVSIELIRPETTEDEELDKKSDKLK